MWKNFGITVAILAMLGLVGTMFVSNVVADWRAAWGDCGPRVGGSHGR